MLTIVIHVNAISGKWFFSTNHCQPDLNDDWVPVSYSTRFWDIDRIREANNVALEIDNPNPRYRRKGMAYYHISFHFHDTELNQRWVHSSNPMTDNPTKWAKTHCFQDSDYLYATTIVEV